MRVATIILVQIVFTMPPKKTTTQHIRNQTESLQRDEITNAGRQRVRTKWTKEMNADLIDSRTEAEQLYNSNDCPKKDNGRKIAIMELTKRIFDEKGNAYLQKTPGNLRDQYAYLTKTTKTCTKAITKEMKEQRDAQTTKDQECSPRTPRERLPTQQQPEQRPNTTPPTINSPKFNELSELAKTVFLNIKDDSKELESREQTTFTKVQPNKEDSQVLNEIIQALVTTLPEANPAQYLWEINCAIYATAVAWKSYTGNKTKTKPKNTAKDQRPKWMRIIDNQIITLRKQISQITEEIRRLEINGKLTSKLRRNRKWMRSEIKDRLTKRRLQELKEKKINQLRTKKIQRKRKITSYKRRIANKQFDRSESKFYDHCRNIIKADAKNDKPIFTDEIPQQPRTDESSPLTINDFDEFWRPIWESEKDANLETEWIRAVTGAIQSSVEAPTEQLVNIDEKDIYTSVRKKRNWSSPGNDKITNYWLKTLSSMHKGLATAVNTIVNNDMTLPDWLVEGKCVMIPKKENPQAKDHRPITLLNTMYKTITSVIDSKLKKHQDEHHYMQIDQRGCTTNSMGCIDNLIIDKTTLEEARDRRKNLSCTWIDVKKAFDSINHKWLAQILRIHNIPTKIANFITNTMKKWSITIEVKINDKKEKIGPIRLKQGILQGDSFCVRLFTLCLNPIAWWLRSTEGYTYSHNKQEKLTHLLYVDDLKTYHKSAQKAVLITKKAKSMFEDIGLYWGMDKCATVNIVRGRQQVDEESVSVSETEELKVLDSDDYYKFLGKFENAVQLEQQVCNEAAKEYLKRVSVIWSSNISTPRKLHATKTFALPALEYHMWTSDWQINSLKDIDRRTRDILREHGGMHHHESVKLLYLPQHLGGGGLKSAEDTYKQTTIKMANYLNNCEDMRIKHAKAIEKKRIEQGRRSLFKDAVKYAAEYKIKCTFSDNGTLVTASKDQSAVEETMNITTPTSTTLKDLLKLKTAQKYKDQVEGQKWLGAFTTKHLQDQQMSSKANQILNKWKNIPDIVYSVNQSIRQQLLPTKTYQQGKAQMAVTDTKCRMCHFGTESTTHVLSACPKIAQSLYTARHDRMLRPIYHCLLDKYNFEESDHRKPWYQQSLPSAVLENEEAKIYWNVPFMLERPPENGANKPDVILHDKKANTWMLLEGTVCQVNKISDRTQEKQAKYTELRAGIKREHKSTSISQINIVFDFLGGYHDQLRNDLRSIMNTDKEVNYLVERCQKWILSQNVNIVKKFYEYV